MEVSVFRCQEKDTQKLTPDSLSIKARSSGPEFITNEP